MSLARLRRRASFSLRAEDLARAVAPACFVLLLYLVVALFGFGQPYLSAAMLLLAAALLAWRLARLRRPAAAAIDRRIEQVSGLRHRPIAMLEDAPENDSELAAAIWRLHQRRLARSLASARAGRPALNAELHDPYAMRGLLLLLLLAGAVVAGPNLLPRLAGAFALPSWPFSGPSAQAWITLPAYTGAPPLVLAPGDAPVVPAGSRLTLVVGGARARPAAFLGGARLRFGDLASGSFRADAPLHASARLRVGPWWDRLAGWNITVVPPSAPRLSMRQPQTADRRLVISWHAQDRYGIAALNATLLPVGHPGALRETLGLALSTPSARDLAAVSRPDIADSPYAGMQVAVTLSARNLAGVSGSAGPMTVRLPPPDLHDPTAAALAALRQRLALAPRQTSPVGAALRHLAEAPPSRLSAGLDLQMAFLGRQLAAGEIAADTAQKLLGQLAQQIELGPDYAPAQALQAADQALEQALSQAITTGGKLDDARLKSLLAAMHAALARHLQALGPSAARPNGNTMNPADLDRMAEQIARDQAAGRSAQAAAELDQLERMLAALQSARPMSAAQAARAAAADQAAQDLGRMTQGESKLLDQTNQGNGDPGAQARLQQQLAQMRQGLQKSGIALPGLQDAGDAMATAHAALKQSDIGTAATAEGSAIQALQKAAAALAASGAGMSFGETAGQSFGQQYGDGIDGAPDEDSIPGILPSSDSAAGAIQRQIIHNDDNPALPASVHQYYHRLLNQDQNGE